jgi:hypothetical protein
MTAETVTATDWRLVDERAAGGFLYIDRGPAFDFLQLDNDEHARLIAAAPALLAALKTLADVSRSYIGAMDLEDIDALLDARAVIAAAEARS